MNPLAGLLSNPDFVRSAARLIGAAAPQITFGKTAIFSKWEDVRDILNRDLDFLIAPVNGPRIEAVNGPFILGMDRSETHLEERRALYAAMRTTDWPALAQRAGKDADDILKAVKAGDTLDIVNGYARPVAGRSATALMGIAGPSEADLMRVARALFHECFLNLNDDPKVHKKALTAFGELKPWVEEEIAGRRKKKEHGDDMIGRLITEGALDDDAIRRTVSGMLVGAIDTTATCVAYILDVILSRPEVKCEVLKDLNDPVRMRGWCYEALRFRPHNPIVIRQAAADTSVGGKAVKAGTRVICFTLSAMHDPGVFAWPERFDPERPEELYLHFGGGLHPCAGRALNGVQIPALVSRILARDPVITEKIRFEGPFPDRLTIKLRA